MPPLTEAASPVAWLPMPPPIASARGATRCEQSKGFGLVPVPVVFEQPPRIELELSVAALFVPPLTDATSALAVFAWPPLTDADSALAVLLSPPLTDARRPLAVLRMPPVTEATPP